MGCQAQAPNHGHRLTDVLGMLPVLHNTSLQVTLPPWKALVLAVCAVVLTWSYVRYVLPAADSSTERVHAAVRGNGSDLYPRWYGSRELLLRGRNPYSAEVTREIQIGFYGRTVDNKYDQSSYAYPVYLAPFFAPFVNSRFDSLQTWFSRLTIPLLIALALFSAGLARWPRSCILAAAVSLFVLASVPGVEIIASQQITVVVITVLVASAWLTSSDHFVAGGFLLGLAMVKPHLVLIYFCWLAIWSLADWRQRRRLWLGFSIVMLVQLSLAQILLPGWIVEFVHSCRAYAAYTHAENLFSIMLPRPLALIASVGTAGIVAVTFWNSRKVGARYETFPLLTCFAFAATLVLVPFPTAASYNSLLLLPGLLLVFRYAPNLRANRAQRLALMANMIFTFAPWTVMIVLSISSAWIYLGHLAQLPLAVAWLLPAVNLWALGLLRGGASLGGGPMRPRADERLAKRI